MHEREIRLTRLLRSRTMLAPMTRRYDAERTQQGQSLWLGATARRLSVDGLNGKRAGRRERAEHGELGSRR